MDVSAAALSAARAGERWVLRYRLPDGSATDVIGWLERVDSRSVRLSLLHGDVAQVSLADVIRARRVPAAPGGPDPRRTSAAELERHALLGWVAVHEPLGEWVLRAAGGFTRRANSCLAVGDPGLPVEAAAAAVVGWANAHGILALVQVIVGSEEEAALVRLRWRPADVTDVLTARLADFLADTLPDPRIRVSEELSAEWEAAYQRSRPDSPDPRWADPRTMRKILQGNPPRAFAGLAPDVAGVPGPGPLAIGRGHVSGPWLGLAAIWTDPSQRRQGWATRLSRALGHWGARQGARSVYAQVAAENLAAREAYGRLGFVHHHSYRYLAGPG